MKFRCALVAAVLVSGCATRDRANPLDPENQETGGYIAGFNALAGDRQVEIRWDRIRQQGVLEYRLLRWTPGSAPAYAGGPYGSELAGAVDSVVVNGQDYVYRLVARLASGDSAVSLPDTATPGPRRIVALAARLPGLVGLTPDARDVLYAQPSQEAYEDMELDSVRNVLWLTLLGPGRVLRLKLGGASAGPPLVVHAPADVSVSNLRGVGWIAEPASQRVSSYGPDLGSTTPAAVIPSVGVAHVVEASSGDPTVWIGNDNGTVFRFTTMGVLLGAWSVAAPVAAIALDEDRERAWVATRGSGGRVHVIDGPDSTVTPLPDAFQNIVDLAFDPGTRTCWVSDRGIPFGGTGRLVRLTESGATAASVTSIEPFGITVDPRSGTCWASDVRSNRLLEVSTSGAIVRWSAMIDLPYGVRLCWPGEAP